MMSEICMKARILLEKCKDGSEPEDILFRLDVMEKEMRAYFLELKRSS